ncbi:MAG: hypothetical protein KDG52_14275 [Rhodocyclaceae bacterium]|nr:hypothetical protein [Rhodocyclaceae bacterium]
MPRAPQRLLAPILALTATASLAQQSIEPDDLAAARSALQSDIDAEAMGAAYAAMVSVTTAPEISAATYRIRDGSSAQPTMRLYKLPLAWSLGEGGRAWQPFAHASLGLMEFGIRFELLGEAVRTRWTAYGGSVGLGVRIPRGHWTWIVQGGIGVVRIENRAHYRGVLGQTLLAPLFKGLIFDWHADAAKYSVAVGADFRRDFAPWRLELRTRLSGARADTFSSSSEFVDFDATGAALTIRSDASRAIAYRVAGRPTRAHLSLGATAHLGAQRDALGFDRFVEAGGGIELDLADRAQPIESVRLGMLAIFGPDVVGWSLSASLGF